MRPKHALLTLFLLMVGYMFIQIFNGRFNMYDFQVYYRAAERISAGQNLYQIAEDGFFIFKYSAVSALYFLPFSWLPIEAAKVVYWLGSSAAFIYILFLVYRLAEKATGRALEERKYLYYFISFICLGSFIELEILLGQVNVFVLLLILASANASMNKQPILSGILLSVSIFLKPFGLVLVAYFIYRMKYKELFVFAGSCIILFLLPIFWYGSLRMLLEQNQLWFNELMIEIGNEQDILTPETHTIFSIIARYTPLRWIHWSASGTLVFQALVLVVIGILFILLRWHQKRSVSFEIFELALLLTLIPLTLYTGRNLYIFSVLSAAILISIFDRLNSLSRIFLVTGIFISCFNIIEIWGPKITSKWEEMSLISVGTLIIWIILYIRAYGTLKTESG